MTNLHMNDTVFYWGVEVGVDVSTCETPDAGWETCVFLPGGESDVVANYVDIEAAVVGHHAFLQRDVLRAIVRGIQRSRAL
jgi:hypothetical protein